VLLHGFTGQALEPHRFFIHIARALAVNGIAAFRFDYRGSGNSEGDFSEMTAGREVQDARAALRLLQSQVELDRERFGLLGLSMGGMVAALTAGIESFKALCLLAPTKPQHMLGVVKQAKTEVEIDSLFDSEFAGFQFPPAIRFNSSRKVLDFGGNPVSSRFFKGLLEFDSVKSVASHMGSSIVIHGSDDQTVPVAIGQEYATALKTKLLEIVGGNHTFDDLEHQEQVIQAVLEFYGSSL
jgi:uncharacterized protein